MKSTSILLALKVEDVFLLSKFLIHSNLIGILKISPFVFKTLLFSFASLKKIKLLIEYIKTILLFLSLKKNLLFMIEIF